MELMQTDLPEPVAPAMSKCGILVRSDTSGLPETSLPSAIGNSALAPSPIFALENLAHAHRRGLLVGDFHADRGFAGNRGEDAHRLGAHAQRDVLSKPEIFSTRTPAAGTTS